MRTPFTLTLSVAAVAALGLGSVASAGAGRGADDRSELDVVGLSQQGTALVSFGSRRPDKVEQLGDVDGLSGDARLVGIDYRVQNGALYGVGNAGGLYVLDATDAEARKVGQLTVALSGAAFGVDFNPAANALRIVSDTGQNLRQAFPAPAADGSFADGPTAATVTDGPLNYPGPQATPVPGPAAPGVTGAAYTNNDLDPRTATTLVDLDTTRDQLAVQSPANSGFLAPTGSLSAPASGDVGFDVFSVLEDGRAVAQRAFAAYDGGFYAVDLLEGTTRFVGPLGDATVVDIAIPTRQ